MARRCPIDDHPERAAIDGAILSAIRPERFIAERYHVGAAALRHHRRRCLAPPDPVEFDEAPS